MSLTVVLDARDRADDRAGGGDASRGDGAEPLALLTLPSRVLPPGDCAKVLEWAELPAWLKRQRDARMEALSVEMLSERTRELEALHAILDEEREAFERDLAAQRLAAVIELHGSVVELSQTLAHTATEAMRKAMGWGEPAAQGFYSALLRRMMGQTARSSGFTIMVAATDEAAVRASLEQLGCTAGVDASVVVEPGVRVGQCLIRTGQDMYECDTDSWLNQVRKELERSCLDALLSSAVQHFSEATGNEAEPWSNESDGDELGGNQGRDLAEAEASEAFDEHEGALAEEALERESDFDPRADAGFDDPVLEQAPGHPDRHGANVTRRRLQPASQPDWADQEPDSTAAEALDALALPDALQHLEPDSPMPASPRRPTVTTRTIPNATARPNAARAMPVRSRVGQPK